ncbi:MAG: hypothetical protein IKB70_06890 [Bacilli bacterium]|nr:hypothetical protein [Bacilli bacterium]
MKKKKNSQEENLPLQILNKAKKIFDSKQWNYEDELSDYLGDFCRTLSILNEEQQELLLMLTQKFLWIKESEYLKHFLQVFDAFVSSYDFDNVKTIMFCPALPEDDFGKPKSSVALLYKVKGRLSALQEKYNDFNITYIDSPQFLCNVTLDDTILCLIDDFVGSGETIERVKKYIDDNKYSTDKLVVVSLVSMANGKEYVKKLGIELFANIVCEKGISGCENEEANRLIMEQIEKTIKVKSIYHFGYSQSEGLVKMIRTPNNTFPIYWLKNKQNSNAPFPRS